MPVDNIIFIRSIRSLAEPGYRPNNVEDEYGTFNYKLSIIDDFDAHVDYTKYFCINGLIFPKPILISTYANYF